MATISGNQFFGGAPGQVIVPGSQIPQQPPVQKEPSLAERIVQDYKKRGEAVVSDVNRPADLMSQGASPLKVAGATLEAGLRTVGNVAGAAFDPISEALSPVVKPIIEKLASIPGVSGGVQSASEWATKHPEAAKDLGAVFNIATLPAGGLAETGGKALASGAGEVASKVASPLGKALKGVGEAVYGLTVPMEESTSKALLAHQAEQGSFLSRMKGALGGEVKGVKPITEANTAARMGLVGTEREIGVQAKQFQTKLWDELKPKLDSAKNITDMRKFISEIGGEIKKNTPELGRRNALLEALQSFAEDYKKVGTIGGTKLQEYKSGWAKLIPEATYKGKPIGSALKEVKNMAASKARGIIYDALGPESKQSYIDYHNLETIVKSGIKSSTGDLAKKSLTRDIWQAVMDKVVTPVATVAGKVLYRTGEGLEFIGEKGAKKVGDIMSTVDIDPQTGTPYDRSFGL